MDINQFKENLDKYIHGELDEQLSKEMQIMMEADPLIEP